MRLKDWWAALRGPKKQTPWNKGLILQGSNCGLILEKLCDGEWMGGREACALTKSHNGLRRLNDVKKLLRRNGIPYWQDFGYTDEGKVYRLIKIWPDHRERARALIRGAR